MPPICTQQKNARSSAQAKDVAVFDFEKIVEAEVTAAAASIIEPSSAVVHPEPNVSNPVGVGVTRAHFPDSRTSWDGKYHTMIGTSTRAITFGSDFKLTDKHIHDIIALDPEVHSKLTVLEFTYANVGYKAHNDANGVTDQGVLALTKACPKLKKLILPGTSGLGNISLCAALCFCPHITHLEISSSIKSGSRVDGQGFAELVRHPGWAPKLRKLLLADRSNVESFMEAMREFLKTRPRLPIELVSASREKRDGDWELITDFDTYRKGGKLRSANPAMPPKKRIL